jgi:probable HAF family extracellular repeat protein
MRGGMTLTFGGLAAVMTVAGMLGTAGSAMGQTYHVRDLGTLGGIGDTQAFALSRLGLSPRVAGFATKADHAQRGFMYDGAMHEIIPLAPDTQTIGYGVDGQGRVVGVMFQLGEVTQRAFRTGGATLTGLGTFTPRGVNEAGDIAGYMPVVESVGLSSELQFDHACVHRGGALTDLGTMNNSHWSRAYAINNLGHLVGCTGNADDRGSRAVVWIDGTPHELPPFGVGGEACAYAVNEYGLAVGYSTGLANPGIRYAAVWWYDGNGQVTQYSNLGTLPAPAGAATWSYAYGVNARGAFVGTSNGRAFLFDYGHMKDLNELIPPGWFVVAARAINDSDAIAAWGVTATTNEPRPLLITPCHGDFNRDGAVGVQDIFDFLEAYFTSNPRADYDHDGAVGVGDIFSFLETWFGASC